MICYSSHDLSREQLKVRYSHVTYSDPLCTVYTQPLISNPTIWNVSHLDKHWFWMNSLRTEIRLTKPAKLLGGHKKLYSGNPNTGHSITEPFKLQTITSTVLWDHYVWLSHTYARRGCNAGALFVFISGGTLSDYYSLLSLHLGGTPSLKADIRPPSCLLLGNRLYLLRGFVNVSV